jgi:tetratricopeptide (TPR) repeat protein
MSNIYPRFFTTLVVSFLTIALNFSFAQGSSDNELANYYFQLGEYDKAAMYYERLYKNNQNDFFYNNLFKCYLELEDYKSAEKIIKNQQKINKNNPKYSVDQGILYKKTGETEKAKKQFEKAIKELPASQGVIIQLARIFEQSGETQYALETYLQGKKLLKNQYPFNVEIAEIYASQRKWEEMILSYLDLLTINPAYIQTVQNALHRTVSFDKKTKQNQILQQELIKKTQTDPNNKIFPEMLIWTFVQMEDFANAFIQIKALDKRFKEDGGRVLALARTCETNKNYDIAVEAYKYIIDNKGKDGFYYSEAKTGLVNVLKTKITTSGNYSQEDILFLKKEYNKIIHEFENTPSYPQLLKELATIEAYYLFQVDSAITLLNKAILHPTTKPHLKAECKLDLGDLLLMKGDLWESILLYAQVDKDFKYDQLGEQAKLKTAKAYYYVGDFNFSKGQLDVLKGSTSKLIANDAMELSRLITDNTTVDTSIVPMQIYARAELLFLQNKMEQAQLSLDTINKIYIGHSLEDDILMLRYRIAMKQKNHQEAATYLEKITTTYKYDILADKALFLLAEMNENIFQDKDKAMQLYEKLLVEYAGSIYVVEARKKFRYLRGDNL